MRTRLQLLVLTLLAIVALVGCQDDDGLTGPTTDEKAESGLVRGEIDDLAVEFEFLSDPPDQHFGPFLIRGHNLHHDPELGALVVDLTVVNAGERTYPEPVTLTFASLLPDTITVLNADNGETGPGALFQCQFENDDAQWAPGEESLPFTVQFGVDQGVSIGFVARVDVGLVPGAGAIGGIVWHDVDEDGAMDPDEAGLPDVGLALAGPGDLHLMALTGPDGAYRFDDLPAGYYTVTRLPREDLRPTTPPQMQVILVVDEDGDVVEFLAADFGCLVVDAPPPGEIEVGDCLHVKGDWSSEPPLLVVDHYCFCEDDDDDPDKDDDCWQRLSGPVTAVGLEDDTVTVMGAVLHITDDSDIDVDLDELTVGDRVRTEVNVVDGDDGDRLEICRLRDFGGNWDRVRGFVQDVVLDDDGHVQAVEVTGVEVDLGDAHMDDDCDDD